MTAATSVQATDRFVLEQSGQAKSLTGQILLNDLATALNGHGGISNITYTAPVAPSLDGTLTITMADQTAYNVTVENGNGISSIDIYYGVSNQGTNPAYVTNWYSVPTPPTDYNPYQWTRIRITDKTANVTDAYSVSIKADNPTVTVGTVSATSGGAANATVTNSGTVYNPVLDFAFTMEKGDKGDTGDYIVPVVSFGTSTAAATEPSTWYSSASSLSYAAGNFIWQRTQYTLHDAQTVQSTETKIIGYIGQNGAGSGTVTQITFNGDVFADDGTGNVDMTVDATDVGAIADPVNKSNGQVPTWDASLGEWVAATPSTGNVNTVNNVGVTAGTTNIQLYATSIPMSSGDNTTVQAAIPTSISQLANDSNFITAAGAPVQSVNGATGTIAASQLGCITLNGASYNAWQSSSNNANDLYTGMVVCNETVQNTPSADWWLIMSAGTSGTVTQVAFRLFNDDVPQTRYCATNVWSNWQPITVPSDSNKSNTLLVEAKSNDNISISAGVTSDIQISCSKTGYTPIGVVGYRIANASNNGANCTYCFPFYVRLVSDTAHIYCRNTYTDTAKVEGIVDVLYVKN